MTNRVLISSKIAINDLYKLWHISLLTYSQLPLIRPYFNFIDYVWKCTTVISYMISTVISYSDLSSHQLQWSQQSSATVISTVISYSDLSSHQLQWSQQSSATVISTVISYSDLSSHQLQWPQQSSATVISAVISYSDLSSHKLHDLSSHQLQWSQHHQIQWSQQSSATVTSAVISYSDLSSHQLQWSQNTTWDPRRIICALHLSETTNVTSSAYSKNKMGPRQLAS